VGAVRSLSEEYQSLRSTLPPSSDMLKLPVDAAVGIW